MIRPEKVFFSCDILIHMLHQNALLEKVFTHNQLSEIQIHDILNPSPLEYSNSIHLTSIIGKLKEIKNLNQKVFICGDYDVDGLCSTSILVKSLRAFGLNIGFYIPDRINDGYGINLEIAKKAIEKGYHCILMVDNGVSAFEVIDYCHLHKITTIVVDHHEIRQEIKSDYLLHPDLLEDAFESMCASSLAHQISVALIGEDEYVTSLAALATIADMMPVFKQNRALIRNGLELMNQNKYLNIYALLKDQSKVNEDILSFQVIPKLNAVGRLADRANANRVVEYLLSTHSHEILNFASKVYELNEERKQILESMMTLASQQISNQKVIVLKHPHFHEGIVGIAAGRIAQNYQRPTIILNESGDRLKGSARSYGNLSLSDLFATSFDLFTRFGGHAQAAGLELSNQHFETFIKRLNDFEFIFDVSEDYVDADETVDLKSFLHLDHYRPFGQGFKIPSFRFVKAKVISFKAIKNGIKYQVLSIDRMWDVLDFSASSTKGIDDDCSFVAKISTNSFNGNVTLSLMIEKWL